MELKWAMAAEPMKKNPRAPILQSKLFCYADNNASIVFAECVYKRKNTVEFNDNNRKPAGKRVIGNKIEFLKRKKNEKNPAIFL